MNSAEFSGALGGVVAAHTKSGSDVTYIKGHYSFDGSALAAAPPKRLVLDPTDLKTVSYVYDPALQAYVTAKFLF